MTDRPVEVVKVGGSLLARPNCAGSLRQWLGRESRLGPQAHRMLIVGGGGLVDALRRIDAANSIDERVSHWQAIECMELNAKLVRHWLPEIGEARTLEKLRERCSRPGVTLFYPLQFLQYDEPHLPGVKLPVGWQVTSDSIAARLAIGIGADRLRLLKSRPATPDESADWTLAARQGVVDEFFPRLVSSIPYATLETLERGAHGAFKEYAQTRADC